MDSDEDFVTGGTRSKTDSNIKNLDKHNVKTCIAAFNMAFIYSEFNLLQSCGSCYKGELSTNYLRSTIWRMMLGCIPKNRNFVSWVEITNKNRQAFKIKMKSYINLKSIAGDPLGGSQNDGWNSFFEDNEAKKLINLDISRTYQDKELFQSSQIKEILRNVLFIWHKENNKEPAYQQGMNELCAVILFAIYPFYTKAKKVSTENLIKSINACKDDKLPDDVATSFYNFLHDQDELQADLFFLFESIMNKGIRDIYIPPKESVGNKNKHVTKGENANDNREVPLSKRCKEIINVKLKIIDDELLKHFNKIDLECAVFVQRWIKCIFNREFHPTDVLLIWDATLASDYEESIENPDYKSNLVMIDYICLAMLSYLREELLSKDQNACLMRCFKYPPIETTTILVRLALKIKNKISKHYKSNKTPVTSSDEKKEPELVISYNTSISSIGQLNHKDINDILNGITNTTDPEYIEKIKENINKIESSKLDSKLLSDPTSASKNENNEEEVVVTSKVLNIGPVITPSGSFKPFGKKTEDVSINNDTNTQHTEIRNNKKEKIIEKLTRIYNTYINIFNPKDSKDLQAVINMLNEED